MTRAWGPKSTAVYNTLDRNLQNAVDFVLLHIADISLIEGHRSQVRQDLLYSQELTRVRWPNSKHNTDPSMAVDLQPYPKPQLESELREALSQIAGAMKMYALLHGYKIRWGGDWDRDGEITDNDFDDLFHFEIDITH
jgi:hypothetical protein